MNYTRVLITRRITFFNIRNDMPQEILKIENKLGFNCNITLLLQECYTDFWPYN